METQPPISPEVASTQTPKQVESVGDEIRRAREARGWEIDDVSERLKIGSRRVTVIETGTYDKGQMNVYYRGYFRSYCRLLNLNSDALLDALENEGVHVHDEQPQETATSEAGWSALKERNHSNISVMLVGLFVICLFALGAWTYKRHSQSNVAVEQQISAVKQLPAKVEQLTHPTALPAPKARLHQLISPKQHIVMKEKPVSRPKIVIAEPLLKALPDVGSESAESNEDAGQSQDDAYSKDDGQMDQDDS